MGVDAAAALSFLVVLSLCLTTISAQMDMAQIEIELVALANKDPTLPPGRVRTVLRVLETPGKALFKELVMNELLVRKHFSLELMTKCKQTDHNIFRAVRPPKILSEYMSWQKAIIQAKPPLCNVHKYLTCHISGSCRCAQGMQPGIYTTSLNASDPSNLPKSEESCLRDVHETCGEFDRTPIYYDPLSLKDETSPSILPTPRRSWPICSNSGDLPCEKLDYFIASHCLDDFGSADHWQSQPFFKAITDNITATKLTLDFDADCDPVEAATLLAPPPPIGDTFAKIVLHWEETLTRIKDGNSVFCNLRKLLYCHPDRKKCACLEPTVRGGGGKCRIQFWKRCGIEGNRRTVTAIDDAALGSLARDALAQGVMAGGCAVGSSCLLGPVTEEERYHVCTCDEGRIGKNCDTVASKFLRRVSPASYASDVEDLDKKVEIFVAFNAKMMEVEQLMTLKDQEPCVADVGATQIVDFVGRLLLDTTLVFLDGKTKSNYERFGKLADQVAASGQTLCDATPGQGLECGEEGKCVHKALSSKEAELTKELMATQLVLKNGEKCVTNLTLDSPDQEARVIHLMSIRFSKIKLCNEAIHLYCLSHDNQGSTTCGCLSPLEFSDSEGACAKALGGGGGGGAGGGGGGTGGGSAGGEGDFDESGSWKISTPPILIIFTFALCDFKSIF